MKWLVYFLFFVLYMGVTFFGLGPVMFADGTLTERIYTLVVVIFIYVLLSIFLILFIKRKRKS